MLHKGEIATAPAAGTVDVLIPAFDAEQPYQGAPFMPRGATNPTVGDACWIDFDDQGDPVVVVWTPA